MGKSRNSRRGCNRHPVIRFWRFGGGTEEKKARRRKYQVEKQSMKFYKRMVYGDDIHMKRSGKRRIPVRINESTLKKNPIIGTNGHSRRFGKARGCSYGNLNNYGFEVVKKRRIVKPNRRFRRQRQ